MLKINGVWNEMNLTAKSKDNPEKTIIKNDLFEDLSGEAKYLIHIIFTTPNEIIRLAPKRFHGKKLSKNTIRYYLKNRKFETRHINSILWEIKQFTRELTTI